MGFKKGDSVRIARDLYPDDDSTSFVGRVGRITSVNDTYVTVDGLGELGQPRESKSWGFDTREVEQA